MHLTRTAEPLELNNCGKYKEKKFAHEASKECKRHQSAGQELHERNDREYRGVGLAKLFDAVSRPRHPGLLLNKIELISDKRGRIQCLQSH